MVDLNGNTVLVVGGAGFIGSALIRELLAVNARVISFDNYFHGHPSHLLGLTGPITIIQGDVLDVWTLFSTVNDFNVDYIFNCVGDTFVPSAYEFPQRFFEINLYGNLNILMAAKNCSSVKRVVYLSSTEVYGNSIEERVSETTQLKPVNTYAVSKLAADQLCTTLYIEHKIPVVIARIFNCYGPRETHPYIIPEIIAQLSKSNVLCLGNIRASRDFTYVHDTARALIATLVSDIPNGEAVNIGSDNLFAIEWLARVIAEIMGISDLKIEQDPRRLRRCDIDRFRCDNRKLIQYTNWQPTVKIHDGLRQTIEWYKDNGNSWSWERSTQDLLKDSSNYSFRKLSRLTLSAPDLSLHDRL